MSMPSLLGQLHDMFFSLKHDRELRHGEQRLARKASTPLRPLLLPPLDDERTLFAANLLFREWIPVTVLAPPPLHKAHERHPTPGAQEYTPLLDMRHAPCGETEKVRKNRKKWHKEKENDKN